LRSKYYEKFLTFCENKYFPSWKDEDNPGYRQVDVFHEDVVKMYQGNQSINILVVFHQDVSGEYDRG
jgi:hypothetical protein